MAIQSNFPAIKPSLLLDFANTKQLDPRITFTRASTATYYDGVTTAMAEQNLLTYSEQFDNAAYTKNNVTVTANSSTAPDGTSTADLVFPSSTGVDRCIGISTIAMQVGLPYTISVYAKASGLNFIYFLTYSGGTSPTTLLAFFNLSTGAVGQTGSYFTSASIVSVGNGWYRCTATANATIAGSYPYIGLADANNSGTATASGSNGVLLWGFQLEQRSAVTAYTATTTQPITNYIPVLQTAASGVARFDNNPTTGESLGLLIEEARTNLYTYSSQFDNTAWTKESGATITQDAVVSPDGTLNADILNGITNGSSCYQLLSGIPTGTTYTFSIFVKYWSGISSINFEIGGTSYGTQQSISFNTQTGTVISNPNSLSYAVTSVGNGWYRYSFTRATAATGTLYVDCNCVGVSQLVLWGAQFEAGAFATSYIPTVASTVTRNADSASMTGTNFSSWYNQAEGTVYFETLTTTAGTDKYNFEIGDGTANNRISALSQSSNQDAYVIVNGSVVANANLAISRASSIRGAIGFKVNDIRSAFNGSLGAADTSATIPSVNALYLGSARSALVPLNGTISKFAYYPLRVTNTQLQALTS